MKIRAFNPADRAAVVALWQQSGLTRQWNDPDADIAHKLTEQPELFLVGTVKDELVATVFEVLRRLVLPPRFSVYPSL